LWYRERVYKLEGEDNYDPSDKKAALAKTQEWGERSRGKRIPVSQWLGMTGKTKHLLKPEHAATLQALEAEVERRWRRLKAMHEHPLL